MLRKLLNRWSSAATRRAADRLIAEGNQAEDAGNPARACERYRAAAETAPDYAKAHLNLGIGLEASGQIEHARDAYAKALALDPGDPYANYNLGKLVFTRGDAAAAEPLLHAAIRNRPGFPEAHVVLASLREARGDLAGAAQALEIALEHRPDYAGALQNYLPLARKLGRTREAERCLRAALDRNPDSRQAHGALYDHYESLGNATAAARALEDALRRHPDWVDALYNYGCVLKSQVRLEEAEAAFRRALAADPAYFRAYRMLGGVLLAQARIEDALELYRTARERAPDSFELESAELFALGCSEQVSPEDLAARHRAFGKRLEAATPPRATPFANLPDPGRRLRIGYVSGDFCYHVVTLFLAPLIERHDRSQFEVYCYSTGEKTDEFTRKLAARADVWRAASSLPETQLAALIERDRIDVLVDLAGHSGIPQLGVFALQPAPVQATWLGYLCTTGLTRIQYRISDHACDPVGATENLHTEQLVRLPNCQWCYRPFVSLPTAEKAPVEINGFVTFGSFNQAMKLSGQVRALWARILAEVPHSRLVVVGVPPGRTQDKLRIEFAQAGIEESRINLLPYVSLQEYLRWYNQVDIALDTMPYSGGTTTCDALWMGVPVVTAPGWRPASRSAASLLRAAGLAEWIAPSPEGYVRRAVDFAGKTEMLAAVRRSLRETMRASPIMDEARFARDMEQVLRGMWHSWCRSAGG